MKVIILAGGTGTRFWPMSRSDKPKQLCAITSKEPMIKCTYERYLSSFKKSDIYIATNSKVAPEIKKILKGFNEKNFIIEPEKRDTAPAMGYAAAILAVKFPNEPIVFAPSDHYFGDEKRFLKALKHADELIRKTGKMLDIGAVPVFPSTTLGYTKIGNLYKKAKKRGMDFVTFTDHNTIDGCLYLLEKMPHIDDFFISEEVTSKDPESNLNLHINVYNLTKLQHKKIAKIRENLPKLIKYLKEQKLVYSYNHPFWQKSYKIFSKIPKPKERIYEVAKNFHIVEGINSFRLYRQNLLSQKMAKELGMNMVAGSDCHGGSICRAYTLARANNFKEFLKEVKAGRTQITGENFNSNVTYKECMNVWHINLTKLREKYASKKLKFIAQIVKPIVNFGVRIGIKKNNSTQKKIVKIIK